MLEMKNSVNQIRNTVESFTNVSDQLEERIKGKEGRVLRVPQPDPKKGKKQKQKKNEQVWPQRPENLGCDRESQAKLARDKETNTKKAASIRRNYSREFPKSREEMNVQ